MRQIAYLGFALLLLAVGFAAGAAWNDRNKFVTADEAWSRLELCILYFAEHAPTSKGADIGADYCHDLFP